MVKTTKDNGKGSDIMGSMGKQVSVVMEENRKNLRHSCLEAYDSVFERGSFQILKQKAHSLDRGMDNVAPKGRGVVTEIQIELLFCLAF